MPHWLELIITAYLFGVVMIAASAMRRKNRPAFFRNWGWGLMVIAAWFIVIPAHCISVLYDRISLFIVQEKAR